MHRTCRCFATMHLRACRINVTVIEIKSATWKSDALFIFLRHGSYTNMHELLMLNEFKTRPVNNQFVPCILP